MYCTEEPRGELSHTMYKAHLKKELIIIMKRLKCLSMEASIFLSVLFPLLYLLNFLSLLDHHRSFTLIQQYHGFFLSTVEVNDVAFFSQSTITDILDRCKKECNRFVQVINSCFFFLPP